MQNVEIYCKSIINVEKVCLKKGQKDVQQVEKVWKLW